MIVKIDQLVNLIHISEREVIYIVNNIDKYYYDKEQPKTKYGEEQKDSQGILYRRLTPSKFSLKTTQKRINELLQTIKLPANFFGGIKGKNHFLNARQHIDSKYFFTVDLKDFFSNITHYAVFRTFIQHGFSPTIARLLTQLTTFRGKLPQGAPTSPIISNLVFVETNKKLLDFIKEHEILFTTFYDDLSFSSKKDFKAITPTLLEIIRSGGFYINFDKVRYKVKKCEITGLMVEKNKIWPMAATLAKAKKNHFVETYVASIYSHQSAASK